MVHAPRRFNVFKHFKTMFSQRFYNLTSLPGNTFWLSIFRHAHITSLTIICEIDIHSVCRCVNTPLIPPQPRKQMLTSITLMILRESPASVFSLMVYLLMHTCFMQCEFSVMCCRFMLDPWGARVLGGSNWRVETRLPTLSSNPTTSPPVRLLWSDTFRAAQASGARGL